MGAGTEMTLRLSRLEWWLAAFAVALIVVAGYLGVTWASSQAEKQQLNAQLTTLQQALGRIEQSMAGPTFPTAPPGLQLVDLAARSAREAGLEVVTIHSSSVSPEQIGRNVYRGTRVTMRVTGASDQVVEFFGRLEREAVASMVIENMELDLVNRRWEMSLEIFAYAQPS